jgi:NADH-ubiquinone oxidoreductase chain 4
VLQDDLVDSSCALFYLNKGIINLVPSLSFFWFLLVSCNMAAPPSLNLLGEIILINSPLSNSSKSSQEEALLNHFTLDFTLHV